MLNMPYVITLIAPQQAPFFDEAPIRALVASGLALQDRRVVKEARAVDVFAEGPASAALMNDIRDRFGIDILCQDAATRAKRLFMADMDATMVAEETLDELADYAGLKDKIAAITTRAMNGELDFATALRERVALLAGLPLSALAETAARVTYNPGAKMLLDTLKANGIHCVLVSGGFTYFTGRVADFLGFDAHHGNTLNVSGDALSGTVGEPILDKNFKKKCLEDTAARLGITLAQTIAIGDGANDLPMLQASGFGVGWRSKKILRDALPNHIFFGGLETLAYGIGLSDD